METLKGKILHTSWGYDMTLNDYCVVVEETPKSVVCKMLAMKVEDDYGRGEGKATPILKVLEEKPFRLFIRESKWGKYFKGSYPYCNGSKKMGHFNIWDGQPKYHNTWD